MPRRHPNAIRVLDVRSPGGWDAGHLPGSVHRYLPDLVAGIPDKLDQTRPVWIGCASGRRASIAAGLIERHGLQPAVLTTGGIPELLSRHARTAVA